jgi:selenocysteine lyase/cysteine desulfurase
MSPLTRRTFLKGGAAGVALVPLAACTPDEAPVTELPPLVRPAADDDPAWATVRARFVTTPGVAYLNNASMGMPPRGVAAAVAGGYEAISADPLRAKQRLTATIEERVRPGLAGFLGASAGEISLTRNATEALHLAATGLDLHAGDEVLLTTQEHPAGRRPWQLRASRDGITATPVFIPSPLESEEQVLERIERAITPRTRAIAFCHITRGGHRYPVKRIAALARERGLVSLVDGAQAVGMVPVDVHELGCDAYCASLHKWFLGPLGTGLLYVREGAREQFRSVHAFDGTAGNPQYEPPGTMDLPLRAALAEALALAETLGMEAVERRTRFLSDSLKERLAALPGLTMLSGATPATSCPASTIFELAGIDALALVPVLAERHGIDIDEHQRDGHDAIRVSTHVYNTVEEIERLVGALADPEVRSRAPRPS